MSLSDTHSLRETARSVIIRNGEILLIRRTRQNAQGGIDNWLSIPGGGMDPGETPEQTVVRELSEELGLTVKIDRLLAVQDVKFEPDQARHYYFLCTILKGEPRILEQSEEFERMQGKIPNTYAVEWTKLSDPGLPSELFWAYAEAFTRFQLLESPGPGEPLSLLTTGDPSAPVTVPKA